MQGISLKNFKSYNKCLLFDFHPNINVIIGGNGQGKSNLFKSLPFALSERLQINRSEFKATLHEEQGNNSAQQIEVEVVLRGRERGDDSAKVAKIWKSSLAEQCYINSKLVNKKEFESFIEGFNLSYANPYNIVQQGKINQIILMDEFQLYKLLEEITGVKKFNKRKEEALSNMKKIEAEKEETKNIIVELDEKLKSLQGRKEEFEYISIEQKTKKYKNKKHLTKLLSSTRDNIDLIKGQFAQISDNLSKIMVKKKMFEEEIEEGVLFIKNGKEKLVLISKTDLGQDNESLETQQFRQIENRRKQLAQQVKGYAKELREKEKEIDSFKDKFSQLEQKYQSAKLNKQLNRPNGSKDKLLLAYEKQLQVQEQNLQQATAQRTKIKSKLEELEGILKNKKNSENEQKFDLLQSQVLESRTKIEENKKQMAQLQWQKGVLTLECQSLKQVAQQSQIKLRKQLPFLDFGLIDQIRDMNVKGVYGYFVEFVKIEDEVTFAYEIAGMTKLCSLLVEDQQACEAVININKKLKGKQINIIQLDYIRSKPADSKAQVKSKDVRKLNNKNWIKVDKKTTEPYPSTLVQDVQKLIKNTFAKYALVKDYETGLNVSKEYHLNCITQDKQIVYSEGYHCKLGQQFSYNESNIEIFNKFREKRVSYFEKKVLKEEISKRFSDVQNEQIKNLNDHQKMELDLAKMQSIVGEIKVQRKMIQSYQKNLKQLQDRIKQSKDLIAKKKETIQMLSLKNGTKNKAVGKMSEAEINKIETEYNEQRKELNRMIGKTFEIQEVLSNLNIERQELEAKVLNAKNSKAAGVINPKSLVVLTEKDLEQKQMRVKELQDQIQELNKLESEYEVNKNVIEMRLITERAEEEDIENKLTQIGQIEEDVEKLEELEELSNSMSISHMGRRKNHHFSAKDKLLFNKFSHILQSFASHKKTFEELEDAEHKIKRTISQFERDSEQYVNKMVEKFEKQFTSIFTFIANEGNVEIRSKKVTEKVKQIIKYKNCLTVKVSFSNSAEAIKKWNDFSGGEKTVVAISMILALQRCEPAPFYVLDEIDSALDPVYVQKIAQLLSQQTQRYGSQYFISSFKQDMLSFPSDICNYYQVSCENRVSSVDKIDQRRALDALRSIVMKR